MKAKAASRAMAMVRPASGCEAGAMCPGPSGGRKHVFQRCRVSRSRLPSTVPSSASAAASSFCRASASSLAGIRPRWRAGMAKAVLRNTLPRKSERVPSPVLPPPSPAAVSDDGEPGCRWAMLAGFESFPEWASIVGWAAPGRWQALASSSAWRGLATRLARAPAQRRPGSQVRRPWARAPKVPVMDEASMTASTGSPRRCAISAALGSPS